MRWYIYFLTVFLGAAAPSFGPGLLGASGATLLSPADAAVLEAADQRKDLSCKVEPDKAFLGMDLKFHSGYQASIPLRGLEGRGNQLTVLFRVISKSKDPVYFTQKLPVPEIGEKATGAVDLQAEFELGQGVYRVDWMVRDAQGRYCSAHWDIRALLTGKEQEVTLALTPDSVQPPSRGPFVPEPPIEQTLTAVPINLKLLVNFAPQNPGAAVLDPLDIGGLVSILRSIARTPGVKNFSVVAFNLEERRTVYRQSESETIDFPALGDALKQLRLGTVSASQLASKNRNGDVEFLTTLLESEAETESRPDAVILVGLRLQLSSGVSDQAKKRVTELGLPVFYLNYASDRQAARWRDTIGRVVQYVKGREYTISEPRELCSAVSEMMSRISKFKQSRTSIGSLEGLGFHGDNELPLDLTRPGLPAASGK
jgi:hypothetical protein